MKFKEEWANSVFCSIIQLSFQCSYFCMYTVHMVWDLPVHWSYHICFKCPPFWIQRLTATLNWALHQSISCLDKFWISAVAINHIIIIMSFHSINASLLASLQIHWWRFRLGEYEGQAIGPLCAIHLSLESCYQVNCTFDVQKKEKGHSIMLKPHAFAHFLQ
jgi:hypothetical protein